MTIIQLHTHDQLLFQTSSAAIAAGENETVRLLIEKDSHWDGYRLLAVFWRDGRHSSAQSVELCEAGCCLVPPAMLTNSGTLHIALLGRDAAGQTKCSSALHFRIRPGLPAAEGAVLANVANADATPDHVLAGVTFYAGEEEAQVGAIPTYREGEILSDEVVDLLIVSADFSAGDMTVRTEEDALMRAVTVQKPETLCADNIAYGVRIAGVEGNLRSLPEVGEADNGKVLTVAEGQWSAVTPDSELPAVSESDNGKVLAVVAGQWCAQQENTGAASWDELTDRPFGTVPAKTILFEGAPAQVESLDDGEGTVICTYRAAQNFYLLPPENTILGAELDGNSYIGLISQTGIDYAMAVFDGADLTAEFDGYNITLITSRVSMPRVKLYLNSAVTVKIPSEYLPDMEGSLPDVNVSDNGKVLTVQNGAWAAAEMESGDVPFFDLAALGLPNVPWNSAVALTMDMDEIVAAHEKGLAKMAINVEGVGRYEFVATALTQGLKFFYALYGTGRIQVVLTDSGVMVGVFETLPLVTDDDNGKVLTVADGKWTAAEASGGGGGVSSWNDLTDKPFGENADGTVTQIDNKYLAPIELVVGYAELRPEVTFTSAMNSDYGVYFNGIAVEQAAYDRWHANTGTVRVTYDGTSYECEPQTVGGYYGVGNGVPFGGTGNNEPFVVTVAPDNGRYFLTCFCLTDTTSAQHTLTVEINETQYKLREEYLPTDAIKKYVEDYINEALGGDY